MTSCIPFTAPTYPVTNRLQHLEQSSSRSSRKMWQTPWRLSHLLKSHGKRCVLGMETIRNFTSHQTMEDTQVLMVLWNSYPMVDEHPCFHAKCVESARRSGGKTDGYRTRTMASSAFGRCPYVRVTF